MLVYYSAKPTKKCVRPPLLTIPVSEILEARPMYHESSNVHLFEVVLNTDYEDVYLLS